MNKNFQLISRTILSVTRLPIAILSVILLSLILLSASPLLTNIYAQDIDQKKVEDFIPVIESCNLKTIKPYIKENIDFLKSNTTLSNLMLGLAMYKCDSKIVKYIIDINPDVLDNSTDFHNDIGYTPLSLAIITNHYDIVKYLIKKGADVNQIVRSYSLLFHTLLENEIDTDIILLLIKNDADINYIVPISKVTIPMIIALKGDSKLFNYVMKKNKNIDLDLQDNDSRNIFTYAIYGGNLEIIDYLIETDINTTIQAKDSIEIIENINIDTLKYLEEKNINLMLTDKDKQTLWWNSSKNYYPNLGIVTYLINKGFDVDSIDENGKTALEYALNNNKYELAELLFNNGAKLANVSTTNGKPILFHARDTENYRLARLLIDNGADVNMVYDRNTLLTEEVAFNPNVEFVKYLIENGADVHATDEWGYPALLASITNSPLVVLEMLLEAGADIHATSPSNDFPITSAGLVDNPKYAKLLLKYGALIDTQTRDGSTALFYATKYNYIDTVKFLVKNGADVNIKTNYDMTAVDYARWIGNKKMVDYLVSNGAIINEEVEVLGVIEYMMQIIEDGSVGYVQDLLHNGYDVDNRDKYGYTAFLKAVEVGDRYTVVVLVDAGSDINAVTNKNETALMLAKKNRDKKVIEYLKKIIKSD